MSAGPTRRWPDILLTLLALAGVYLGASGVVMAGSFKAAAPWPPPAGHEAYYDRLAARYATLLIGSLLLLAGLLLRVVARWWRQRGRALGSQLT